MKLPCGHIFHTRCVEKMLAESAFDLGVKPSLRCPLCQRPDSETGAKKLSSGELFYEVTLASINSGICTWAKLRKTEKTHMARAHAIWEKEAVLDNDPVAQYHLGTTFFEGHGVPIDEDKGLTWMRRAAEQRMVGAQADLGRRFYHGLGVEVDIYQSFSWTFEAAEQKDVHSLAQLGLLELRLERVGHQTEGSIRWLMRAALNGSPKAQSLIARCYLHGLQGISLSLSDASRWFLMAATQDEYNAQLYAGVMFFFGEGAAPNKGESFRWFVKAAAQGPQGLYLLALMYNTGRGTLQCFEKAGELLHTAATYGHPGACYQLAVAYAHGYGVPVDKVKATEWELEARTRGYWSTDITQDGHLPAEGEAHAVVEANINPLTEVSEQRWAKWARYNHTHKKFAECVGGTPVVRLGMQARE